MVSLFINWHVNPEIFRIGNFAIRWYGLFFVFSFYFGYLIMSRIFKKEGHSIELLDKLTMYMLVATIIGARLGHCFFYQPDFYLKNPLEILKVWHGGLASHGAAIGILIGIGIFVIKHKHMNYMWVVDRIVIVVALAGFFIRMGNLMNSEIVGKTTDMNIGFVFQRLEEDQNFPFFYALSKKDQVELNWKKISDKDAIYEVEKSYDGRKWEKIGQLKVTDANRNEKIHKFYDANITRVPYFYKLKVNEMDIGMGMKFNPRHPTQIYEALSYLMLFVFLLIIYYRKGSALKNGYIFSLFLIILFGVRFVIEFFKEVQVDFEKHLNLNMGQSLSIPFILIGIIILIWVSLQKKVIEPDEH